MTRQPALTPTGIIVGEQMGSARVPSRPKSLAQLHPYTRIIRRLTFMMLDWYTVGT